MNDITTSSGTQLETWRQFTKWTTNKEQAEHQKPNWFKALEHEVLSGLGERNLKTPYMVQPGDVDCDHHPFCYVDTQDNLHICITTQMSPTNSIIKTYDYNLTYHEDTSRWHIANETPDTKLITLLTLRHTKEIVGGIVPLDGILTKSQITTTNTTITNETVSTLKAPPCKRATYTNNIATILEQEEDSEGSMETDSMVVESQNNNSNNDNDSSQTAKTTDPTR
eukprot:706217-Prorocentrum_minimum.AAC.1